MASYNLGLVSRYNRPYIGRLHKKGHLFKSWKLREFTLTGNVLSYAEKGVEKGSYTIDSTSTVRISESMEEYANVFILKAPKGELVMSAIDADTRTEWMEVINEVICGGPLIDIPDVIVGKFNATIPLQISFPSGALANNGNLLTPTQVRRAPVVAFKSVPKKLYTLLMIDPDAPSKAEPMYREFVHWVVVNMPGCDITAADVVAPYFGAAPPHKSGPHRYFIFLYEQPSPLSPTEVSNLMDYFVRRGGFTIVRWAAKMGYGFPVGVEGFHSQWDEYVDELHNEMRFMPPQQYRSPAQVRAMKEFSAVEQKLKQEQDLVTAQARGEEYCSALQLCPDIYPVEEKKHLRPPVFLQVAYKGDCFVCKGAALSCATTVTEPVVEYKDHVSADKLYTLIMTDPDAPFQSEFIHWAVVNIEAGKVKTGTPLVPYFPAAPAYSSGSHRYIFLLYEQHEELSAQDVAASRDYFVPRGGLSTASWVASFISRPGEFNPPVGVNGFTSSWEEICDSIHASMNFMPPSEVRSPSQLSGKVIMKSIDFGDSNAVVSEEVMFFMNSFPKIFNGDLVTKSSDKDMYAKKRWVYINPYTRQLHWAKAETSASSSKFIPLVDCTEISLTTPNNNGNGLLRVVSGTGEIVILELPMELAMNYKKVIAAVSASVSSIDDSKNAGTAPL